MMEDSGKREDFNTGAVRDLAEGKPRPDLISPFAAERLGEWLRLGAEKYHDRNWEKGIPISRCIASLERHLMYYKQGATTEDHMAAVMCNAMFIAHFEEMIKRGVLPEELSDMPDYTKPYEPYVKVVGESFPREVVGGILRLDGPSEIYVRADKDRPRQDCRILF